MKKCVPNVLSEEIWTALYSLLWAKEISGLEQGASIDGLEPEELESNKKGIKITGTCWLLRGSNKTNYKFEMTCYLLKPRFSSLHSITEERIKKSEISKLEVQDDWIEIEVG